MDFLKPQFSKLKKEKKTQRNKINSILKTHKDLTWIIVWENNSLRWNWHYVISCVFYWKQFNSTLIRSCDTLDFELTDHN